MKKIILTLTLLTIGVQAKAGDVDEAQQLYLKAGLPTAEMKDVEAALAAFKSISDQDKTNFAPRFRLASLTSMQAVHTWMPWNKSKFSSAAVEQFEVLEPQVRALGNKEVTYEFHLFRGLTYVEFPGFLKKGKIARQDLEKAVALADELQRHPEEKAYLYLKYAEVLADDDSTQAKLFAQKAKRSSQQHYIQKLAQDILDL